MDGCGADDDSGAMSVYLQNVVRGVPRCMQDVSD